MAAIPELPLGQMVFFCLAKAGELVLFSFSWFGGCGEKYVDKGKPGKEESNQKVFVNNLPHQRLLIKFTKDGRRFCYGGGLA